MSAKHKSHLISEESQYNTNNNSYYSNSNTSTINQTDKGLFSTALNWREIMKLDLRLIHQTNDLTLLEDLLDNLVYGNIKQTDIPLIPEVNIFKLIKVYQFTLNYLLTTQDKLEERIHSLEKKNSAVQSDNITKAAVISKLKRELKKQQQHHHHQQQQTIKEKFICVYCSDKYFDSKESLDVHMERRHRVNEVNEMKHKKREHKERAIEHKLDFLQKQFEEFYLQCKFRKGNEKGKHDSIGLTRKIEEIDEKVEMHIKELKMICRKLSINNDTINNKDVYSSNVEKVSMLIEEINTQNKKRIDLYHSVISRELANIKEEMIMNNTFMLRNQYYNYYNDNMMMNRGMSDVNTHANITTNMNNSNNNNNNHSEQQSCNDQQSKPSPTKQTVIYTNTQTSGLTITNNNNNESNPINANKAIVQEQTIEINNNNAHKSHSKQASSSHIQSNNSSNKSQAKKQSIKSITDIPETQNIQSVPHTRSHHTVSKDDDTNNNDDPIHDSSNGGNAVVEKELTPKELLTIFHSKYVERDKDINSNPSLENMTKPLT